MSNIQPLNNVNVKTDLNVTNGTKKEVKTDLNATKEVKTDLNVTNDTKKEVKKDISATLQNALTGGATLEKSNSDKLKEIEAKLKNSGEVNIKDLGLDIIINECPGAPLNKDYMKDIIGNGNIPATPNDVIKEFQNNIDGIKN